MATASRRKIISSIQRSGNTEQTQKYSEKGDIEILEEQRNGNLNTLNKDLLRRLQFLSEIARQKVMNRQRHVKAHCLK